MRYATVGLIVVFIVVGGCWIASERPAVDDTSPPKDVAEQREATEESSPTEETPELEPALPTLVGDYYESFDLLVNRPLAHRGTTSEHGRSIWIDGGRFDFVRYVLGNHLDGWLLDATVEDADGQEGSVAGIRGTRGHLRMPAFADDAEVLQIRLFNPADTPSRLTTYVENQRIGSAVLEPGWETVQFELDEVDIGADNEVRFEFSNMGRIDGTLAGAGIDWLRIGPEEIEHREPHQLVASQRAAMTLRDGESLAWMVWLHDDASVELEIEAEPGCGPSVWVEVEDGEGGTEFVEKAVVELVEERGDVQTTAIDIDTADSKVARLSIGLEHQDCQEIDLHRARLVRPGTVPGVPDEFEPPSYIVVWVIDTLRADFLPVHFDTDVEAPNLKELARGGVSFETAYVQGTESRASHASLFTGMYPDRHGVMSGGTISPHLPILPHFVRKEGYRTANLAANGYVSHLLNLDRGWDHYRNFIHEEVQLEAEFIVDRGLDWIGDRFDDPFLLYLGTIDPHATYWRHDDFIELYEPADYEGRFQRQLSGIQLEEIKAGTMEVTEREKERIVNLYKNEITYNDHAFGQLRDALEEKGIWEETLVVVTSDHGEEFWEHGSVGHGHNVHQEMVHVPLIFHYPAGLPAGRTVRSGGEVVDVVPTIRSMLDQAPLEDRQGHDLLPKIFGEHGGYPAPVIATQYQLEYGMQIRDWKVIVDSGGFQLFDRSVDPLEMEDVADEHPLASRWLQDSVSWFRTYRDQWDKSRWGVTNNVSDQFLEFIEVQ